jgi:hypothetical protein
LDFSCEFCGVQKFKNYNTFSYFFKNKIDEKFVVVDFFKDFWYYV